MDSLARPLRLLDEDATFFARATELRLQHVTCSPQLRKSALKVLGAIELHPDNRSPLIVLEDAWTSEAPGWGARSRAAISQWRARLKESAEAGLELGELPEPSGPNAPELSPDAVVDDFASTLKALLDTLRAPLEGIIVIVAPTLIEAADTPRSPERAQSPEGAEPSEASDSLQGDTFESALASLLAHKDLASIRWIVMDLQDAALSALHRVLDAQAQDQGFDELSLRSACLLDEDAFNEDLSTLAQSIVPQSEGPSRIGAAWPAGVQPPPMPNAAGAMSKQAQSKQAAESASADSQAIEIELAASEVNPVLMHRGAELQSLVLQAVVHQKRQEFPQAIEAQKQACAIAYDSGAQREALIHHMLLASYHLAASDPQSACVQYELISTRAQEFGCPLERAQANISLALIKSQAGERVQASGHYAMAAEAALEADSRALAIECWRLAGQSAAESGLGEHDSALEDRIQECFLRAIALAEDSTPDIAQTCSAPKAARELAARLRAQGVGGRAQANSLEHTANRLEEGKPLSVEPASDEEGRT